MSTKGVINNQVKIANKRKALWKDGALFADATFDEVVVRVEGKKTFQKSDFRLAVFREMNRLLLIYQEKKTNLAKKNDHHTWRNKSPEIERVDMSPTE